jgi:hypothetical protein
MGGKSLMTLIEGTENRMWTWMVRERETRGNSHNPKESVRLYRQKPLRENRKQTYGLVLGLVNPGLNHLWKNSIGVIFRPIFSEPYVAYILQVNRSNVGVSPHSKSSQSCCQL